MFNKIMDKRFKKFSEETEKRIDQIYIDLCKEYEAKYQYEKDILHKNQLAQWSVDPDYVFSVSKTGIIMLNGQQITIRELKNLKSEVRAIKEFQIWKVLQNTLKQKAIEKGMLQATDLYSLAGNEQVLSGKMMIFNLDIFKTIIDRIDSAKT